MFTTYPQMMEIVRAIHNVADGIPQLIYLVGWQNQGHDDNYPTMDRINPRPGGRHRLLRAIDECKRDYDTTVSYHINIDDAYPESPDWGPFLHVRRERQNHAASCIRWTGSSAISGGAWKR